MVRCLKKMEVTGLELNYLQDFVVLADTLHFQEAANQLYISQSALSKHIKAIEKEFGQDLLDRSHRRVQLTAFGREFLPYARRIVDVQSEYTNSLFPKYTQKEQLISIGIAPLASTASVSAPLAAFSRSQDQYRMRIYEDDEVSLYQSLLDGKCTAIIASEWTTPHSAPSQWREQMRFHKILSATTLVAVLPQGHPLEDREKLYIEDLSGEEYIQLGNGPQRHGALVKPILYVNRSAMAVDLVRRHMGISIISKAAAQNMSISEVVFKDIVNSPVFDISLVYLKSRENSHEIGMLLEHFERVTP
ncbi:MAG: LysR family transcriptional regulator [Lachnospiraceae bacterium]|nr:LysR family transcriptional regulator [Lachnospiraceae bacterium]